jgi:Ni/Co efflux regulator RcnB
MKKLMLAAALATFAASPVLAHNCPNEVSKIDQALKRASLSAADQQKVSELRDKGENEHKTGKHAEATKTLGEAKAILKIQ